MSFGNTVIFPVLILPIQDMSGVSYNFLSVPYISHCINLPPVGGSIPGNFTGDCYAGSLLICMKATEFCMLVLKYLLNLGIF